MPGERVQMPVTFFVDPEIVEDRDAKYTKVITLSYTFYEKEITLEPAQVSENARSKFNQLLSEGKQNGA
jgi:cytochrome c oxidase assembly protein subunit 11